MSNETEQKPEAFSREELQAMLEELKETIGVEEMNRQLEEVMKHFAEENPNSIENKLMRIQKGNFEEMLMPEEYVDLSSAGTIAELLHQYYQSQSEDAFAMLLTEIGWCMMNEGSVLVPTIMRDGRVDMPLLSDNEEGDWVPLFTSAETAENWQEEADMRAIGLEMAVLLATIKVGIKGVVLNPGTSEPMPLERAMLEQMERACNETRQEEARLGQKKQKEEPAVLN